MTTIRNGFWTHPTANPFIEPYQLCTACRKMCDESDILHTLPAIYEQWDRDQRAGKPIQIPEERSERFPHHSFAEFETCVLQGDCHLCALIWLELESEVGFDPLKELREFEGESDTSGQMLAVIQGGGSRCANYCLLSFEIGERKKPNTHIQLLMSAEPYTAPVKTLYDGQLAIDTGSDASLALARQWLQECLSSHPACADERMSAVRPRQLPWRLIDIGENEDDLGYPRLVNSELFDPKTLFLTLSHSWGDGQFLKLTTSNISNLESQIPMQELSQTHRDSISITCRLGYRYIWIDSLCIIQDSADDWRSQSGMMSSIYGNSICTIAAKGSSSHSGCFVRRNPLMHRPCRLLLEGETGSFQGVYAHPYQTATYNSYSLYYSSNAPLLSRAWVQQERLLSPRILYFGGPELHWECCSTQASESWPLGPPSSDHGFDEVYPLKMAFESELKPFQDWTEEDHHRFKHELWHNGVIREYTAAKLTFEKDRMVALAGIATVIQNRTGLTYTAGLWEELLPLDILWYRMDDPKPGQIRRPFSPQWNAPSWSWASVGGRVRYSIGSFRHPEDERIVYLSRIVECHLTPSTQETAILGEVSNGWLTMTGYLVPIVASAEELGHQGMGLTSKTEKRFRPDVDIPDDQELFYFLVNRTVDNDKVRTNWGIVLARDSDHEGCYVRVGIFVSSFDVHLGCIFDGAEEVTITIY